MPQRSKQMNNENPRIEWSQKSGKDCLRFVFEEKLTAKEAEDAIGEWRKAFLSKGDKSIILIWDCRKMKRYDNDAKAKWTDAMKDMRSQIDSIWLISASAIIRLAASAMGMVSSLDIKAIRSESQIVI
jgi:hypothetical protein